MWLGNVCILHEQTETLLELKDPGLVQQGPQLKEKPKTFAKAVSDGMKTEAGRKESHKRGKAHGTLVVLVTFQMLR